MEIDLDELLNEDDFLDEIEYPTKNQKIIKEYPKGTYIFENNEQFKGIIKNNKLTIGIYKWPNGQQYLGDLSNNNFTKRGTIIFPNNNKLIGYFLMNENKIKGAIYETKTRKYIGSFVNNLLDGKFIIKSKDNHPLYLFKGIFSKGKRQGNFVLEKDIHGKILQVIGTYNKGQKNGIFRVYVRGNGGEKKLIYKKNFINDYPEPNIKDYEKIENKEISEYIIPFKICCLQVIIDLQNKIYLLIGSHEYIIKCDINNINTPLPILIFKNKDINDILINKEGNILVCSNENDFKLIAINTDSNSDEIKVLQEFKGLNNSKSIFIIKELSNGLIASGDCENLILWDKVIKNNFYEYKMINHINLTHTYCILEIKQNEKNEHVIISILQPDSRSVLFLDIDKNNQIKLIQKIENINTIHGRKKIMKQNKDILLIGCKDSIISINLTKYEILFKIYFDKITYINILNRFVLIGIIKNRNSYNYEGYLTQIIFVSKDNDLKNTKSFHVSKTLGKKHNGSIIDGYVFELNGKETIITVGNDNKILIYN